MDYQSRMGGTTMIIILLTIASIIIITVFINWYTTHQKCKKVVRQWDERCKTDRYEKKYHRWLKEWEIVDKLNNSQRIVVVYDLPKDIGEEIMNYSLKLIEEKRK